MMTLIIISIYFVIGFLVFQGLVTANHIEIGNNRHLIQYIVGMILWPIFVVVAIVEFIKTNT